jgi:assimilatory nitrate reductase catalytic subunit
MGSRLFSNTTSLLGGRSFENSEHRRDVAGILGIPGEQIPSRDSLPYDQIVQRIGEGAIQGLWIIGTNPSHSWIDQTRLSQALNKLEFLVVQDLYTTTETAQQAHLILPAAGWGEKEGTFINSERRFGLVKKVARAPGQALADFHIFQLVAHYWGCGPLFREWSSPQAVFQIIKRLSKGRPCDITGIRDYRMLEHCGGIQWPYPERASVTAGLPSRERRLFEDRQFYHADGRAKFIFEQPRELPERPDAEYPLLLLTGRGTAAQWHTLTRTGKSDILRRLQPGELHVEVHPKDAARMRVRPNSMVRVISRRGSTQARVLITATVRPGQIFMPMHYEGTNRLTLSVFDPHSRQPAYKFCTARIEPI